jgi:hypothetical protein
MCEFLGIIERHDSMIHLTERGAYISHIIEKEFTHAYLETLWQKCLEKPWPKRIVI